MKQSLVLLACAIGMLLSLSATAAERALFLSGNQTLQGWVYKPKGQGPFPAVVFNQNSGKTSSPDSFADIGQFYTKHGFVLFLPGRHPITQAKSEKEKQSSKQKRKASGSKDVDLDAAEGHAENLVNAMNWLRAQSYVDENRIIVTGTKAGALTSLFAAEHLSGVRGYVIFSPASGRWKAVEEPISEAVKSISAPIFLIQQKNDPSLDPAEALGKILELKGSPNTLKIYDAFTEIDEQKTFPVAGTAIWGKDVLSFIQEAFAQQQNEK